MSPLAIILFKAIFTIMILAAESMAVWIIYAGIRDKEYAWAALMAAPASCLILLGIVVYIVL